MTDRAHTLLKFIASCDVCPSYQEMADHLGRASKNTVYRLLKDMQRAGLIRQLPNKARAIEIVKPDVRQVAYFKFDDETKELVPLRQ